MNTHRYTQRYTSSVHIHIIISECIYISYEFIYIYIYIHIGLLRLIRRCPLFRSPLITSSYVLSKPYSSNCFYKYIRLTNDALTFRDRKVALEGGTIINVTAKTTKDTKHNDNNDLVYYIRFRYVC